MATALKKTKKPKSGAVVLVGGRPIRRLPLPKFKKATKAQIEKQLAAYEELLQMQRDGRIVVEPFDAADWIREERAKDYNNP